MSNLDQYGIMVPKVVKQSRGNEKKQTKRPSEVTENQIWQDVLREIAQCQLCKQ